MESPGKTENCHPKNYPNNTREFTLDAIAALCTNPELKCNHNVVLHAFGRVSA